MTTPRISFSELTTAERFTLAGNLAMALGLLCLNIGATLKLLSEGNLPSGRPVFTSNNPRDQNVPTKDGAQQPFRARDYFS